MAPVHAKTQHRALSLGKYTMHEATQKLHIPRTLKVICDCWGQAEIDVSSAVSDEFKGANETFITRLQHGWFKTNLTNASQRKLIERAFLDDLCGSFNDCDYTHIFSSVAKGLVAEATLHEQGTESFSGGDLGFLVIRPEIHLREDYFEKTLHIRDYKRGLLCQAKIKNKKGRWGHFTKKQKEVLPSRLSYLALLLYSHSNNERTALNPYIWQVLTRIIEYRGHRVPLSPKKLRHRKMQLSLLY